MFPRAPLAVALFLACSSLHAAPTPAPEPDPAARELDRVVVSGQREGYGAAATRTATKTDTPLRDVPQAVTVITREVIEDQAMTSMVDALRLVPGVGVAQGEGHRDAPIFRGNISTSDMFVDGVRDDVQYIRDLYNVERVEVLKGPNAMVFGRGGVGGVINRVTRVADGGEHRGLSVQVGDFNRSRGTFDVGQPVAGRDASFRVTGLYEDSESFRDYFELERYGINPTFTTTLGAATTLSLGYEYFHDERIADRGLPSRLGRPVDVPREQFFGAPALSPIRASVSAYTAHVEHDFSERTTLRNRTRVADYDRFYQNVYPNGTVATGNGVQAIIAAYNSSMKRENVFNQTDLETRFSTGTMGHTLLAGVELGRQDTDNSRINGNFPTVSCPGTPSRANLCLPLANPVYTGSVAFDSLVTNNRSEARVAGVYVQDQIEVSPRWQVLAGVRFDRFDVDVTDRRTGSVFSSSDDLWSPRLGVVWKPMEPVSVYASYSMAYLPRAGEQLSSLTLTTQAVEPEKYVNHEIGAKWDVSADLSLTAAVYRLQRTNVIAAGSTSTNPILIDAQTSRGVELSAAGEVTDAWKVILAYAWQEGEISNPTALKLPQTPRHSASIWNRYDFSPAWGVGLGATYRDEVFATATNAVTLDSFARLDAAVYYTASPSLQFQLNVENLLDEEYFASAHSDQNLMPGSPRAVYLGVNFRF